MADSNAVGLRIASYNLYGLKSGRTMLYELCNDARVAVVAVQEHWLAPNNLNLLNEVNPDFAGFGISAMNNKLKSQIYCGRPYGGVGFLWRRSLASCVRIIGDVGEGRCLAMSFNLPGALTVKRINVYFPAIIVVYNIRLTLETVLASYNILLVLVMI